MNRELSGALIMALLLITTGGRALPETSREDEAPIRDLFAEYLRLHAAKEMDAWQRLFLPEAICARTGSDGIARVYPIAELASGIAEDAKRLASQHETFEDVRIEVHRDAAVYSTRYSLFHDGRKIQQGRAFFSLILREGRWSIASLVWYRD